MWRHFAANSRPFMTGHHQVENNDVGLDQLQLLKRLSAICGLGDQIAFTGKYIAEETADSRLIIDYEYPSGGRGPVHVKNCGPARGVSRHTNHRKFPEAARHEVCSFERFFG